MPMLPADAVSPSLDRLAQLGDEIFDRRVRPSLRPEDDGKFVAIDIGSGGYEIDEDDYAAVTRLRARLPKSNLWLARVGFTTAYQIRRAR